MKMLRKSHLSFLLVVTFVTSGLFSVTQVVFAYSPGHVTTRHRDESYSSVRLLTGNLSSDASSYDGAVVFNEDEERENLKILELIFDKDIFLSFKSGLEHPKNEIFSHFTKQVHVDYLLEEKNSEKTTTSR